MSDLEYIKSHLKTYSDFPRKVRSASANCCNLLRTFQGVSFCDIFPLFRDPLIFEGLITHLTHRIISDIIANSPNKKIDVIVGLDARGFLLGPVIALRLSAAFVPVRKRGKLPGECVCATFEKEYGTVCKAYSLFFGCYVFGKRQVIDGPGNRTSLKCRRTRSRLDRRS
jgi:adenine phosphoribosyltransferase